MTRYKTYKASGFTLIEVIMALFIFSLIAVATLSALRISLNSRDQLTNSHAIVRQLQIARNFIKDDLAQISTRSTRNEFDNSLDITAPFRGGMFANIGNSNQDRRYLIRFVRNGWTNPEFSEPRPSTQYVEYLVQDNHLIRRTRNFLDNAQDQISYDYILLENVNNIEISFLTNTGTGDAVWTDSWPVAISINTLKDAAAGIIPQPTINSSDAITPTAIQFSFDHPRFGTIAQSFWIGRYTS